MIEFFKIILGKSKPKRYFTDEEIKERNVEFDLKHKKTVELLKSVFEIYNSKYCQCAYPRFIQISGINCSDYGNSFKCWETDLLISFSKENFNVTKSELKDESTNERWECKKCKSIYEYGWSDFSIVLERQKLKLIELKTESIGKQIRKPIPLYIGLFGYSYPQKKEMFNSEFEEFQEYILEKS